MIQVDTVDLIAASVWLNLITLVCCWYISIGQFIWNLQSHYLCTVCCWQSFNAYFSYAWSVKCIDL